jgi:hypothetical protein
MPENKLFTRRQWIVLGLACLTIMVLFAAFAPQEMPWM